MSLTSLSIILTVIVLQLHYTGSYAPEISDGLYNFLTKHIAVWIGMSSTVQRYESKRNLLFKRKSIFEPIFNSEKISNLESSLVDCKNNVNSIKNDLILYTANSSLTRCGLNSSKNKHKKKLSIRNSSGKCLENNEIDKYIEIHTEKNIDYGVKLKINDQPKIIPIIDNNHQNFIQVKESIDKSHRKSKISRMENCMKKIDIFSMNIQRYITLHEDQEIDNNIKHKWKLIAEIIDRFLFWIFLVITFVSTVMLLLIIPYLKNNYFSKSLHIRKGT